MYIYDEHPIKRPVTRMIKYENMNAMKGWLTHYGNYKFLKFLADNSDNRQERSQAMREMMIATSKMEWWERHPNFVRDRVAIEDARRKIDADWNSKR